RRRRVRRAPRVRRGRPLPLRPLAARRLVLHPRWRVGAAVRPRLRARARGVGARRVRAARTGGRLAAAWDVARLPEYASILVDDAGPVARITLNRPDKRNPINPELLGELVAALSQCRSRAEVRVIVLAANGPAFSAGGDLGAMKGGAAPEGPRASLVE